MSREKAERSKESYWREVIRRWQESGKTQKEYCRETGESLSSFRWWRCELNRRDRGRKESVEDKQAGFVHLQVRDQDCVSTREAVVELILKDGVRIAFKDGDGVPQSLPELLSVLEPGRC